MKLDDSVLACVTALLKIDPARRPAALDRFETLLGEPWTVRRLGAPNTRSVGAALADGRTLPLAEWLDELASVRPDGVRAVDLGDRVSGKLPPHVAAGFANSQAMGLQLGDRSLFALEIAFSRGSLIAPAQLAQLAQLQPHADRVLEAWARTISEHNELNSRPAVKPSKVIDHLRSPQGARDIEHLGGELMHELQSAVRRAGAREHIPQDYQRFFELNDPDDVERMLLGPDRQHELVPTEEQMYIEHDTTPGEFAQLVDAQPFADEIWQRIVDDLNQFRVEDQPPFAAEDFAGTLRGGDVELWQELPLGNLVGQWQRGCRAHGADPVIPDALRDKVKRWEPAPEERAAKGYVPPRERLELVPNDEPHEVYLFREIAGAPALPDDDASEAVIQADFVSALRDAARLAETAGSPFAEAFRLARFVVESETLQLGDTEPRPALEAAGFSDLARDVLEDRLGAQKVFDAFGPSREKVRNLLACSLADVFGGMGSWNDQHGYFDSPESIEQYEQVSARLFETLRAFKMAVMNAA